MLEHSQGPCAWWNGGRVRPGHGPPREGKWGLRFRVRRGQIPETDGVRRNYMKASVALKFSVVATPVLAGLVGLALVLRPHSAIEANSRMNFAKVLADEVFEMDAATRQYMAMRDKASRDAWRDRSDELARVLASQPQAEDQTQRTIMRNMARKHEAMQQAFGQLVALMDKKGDDAATLVERRRLDDELGRASKSLITGSIDMAEMSHRDVLVRQQYVDSMIVIFSALLAVLLSGGIYFVVRGEVNAKRQMATDLDRSNLMLSDAFVKLRRAEQGIHRERLLALEEMAQGIGNEIRLNLVQVSRISDVLLNYQDNLAQKEKVLTTLREISALAKASKSALDRLAPLVQGARLDLLPQAVSMNTVISDALLHVQARISDLREKGSRMNVVTDLGELPMIDGAETDLREAVANLLLNSIEAMSGGGTLRIKTTADDSSVTLVISDTGQGMMEDVLKHCCEPFFSTKEDGSAGMGLTIVASTVRRHHGSIDIQSKIGLGTTVTIVMPRRQPVDAVAAQEHPEQQPAVRGSRVLVVDDQPWVSQMLKDMLTLDGHMVETARSGEEALELLKGGRFELVVTDRAMPGMLGEELAERVKRQWPGTPVILLTGFGEVLKAAGVSSSSIDYVLTKPLTQLKLREAVVQTMANRQKKA
ncbi:MAG: hypothetical protein C0404_13845 [Verrucomicrobia bacterium]|nr:hypothetical protein [Verrucomicrobiota bacterium]